MDRIAAYWDRTWEERDKGNGRAYANWDKRDKLCSEIARNLHYAGLEKLDIGCGMGIHAIPLSIQNPKFRKTWTGIDLSEKAVANCRTYGLDAHVADIATFETEKRFQLFFLLDCLEHLPDMKAAAATIRRLARKPFIIFGNVPLYRSEHEAAGGFERHVDIEVLAMFLKDCGVEKFGHEVYGIQGYPYMMFEGVAA